MVLENHKSCPRALKSIAFLKSNVYDGVPLSNYIVNQMKLTQFAQMRGMSFAYDMTNQPLIDAALNDPNQGEEVRQNLKMKRIQFDAAPQLSDAVESVCSWLKCSKREFLEMALWDAVERAQGTFETAFAEVAGRDLADAFPASEEK